MALIDPPFQIGKPQQVELSIGNDDSLLLRTYGLPVELAIRLTGNPLDQFDLSSIASYAAEPFNANHVRLNAPGDLGDDPKGELTALQNLAAGVTKGLSLRAGVDAWHIGLWGTTGTLSVHYTLRQSVFDLPDFQP